MRQRHQTIPYTISPVCQTRSFFDFGGEHEFQLVDSTSPVPLLHQTFLDENVKREGVSSECFNAREDYLISGYFPDFGQADRERVTPYVMHDNGVDGKITESPTSYILRKALPFFPEITVPVNWRYWIKRSDHVKWLKEGWKKPKITLYSEFSILNSLFELKQTLALAKSWTNRDELVRRWHKLRGRNARLATTLQGAANERLAHVYGTKLLLADARFLFDALTGINEKVAAFMKNINCMRRLYKKKLQTVEFPVFRRSVSFAELGVQGGSKLIYSQKVRVTSRAVLYYWATAPEFKRYWTRVRQLCDVLGVRIDAGVIWDAIPYTFVVDWFLNIGPWLHNNWSQDAFTVNINYWALGHSAKVSVVETLEWYRPLTEGAVLGFTQPETVTLLVRTSTTYRRSLGETPPIGRMELERNNGPWRLGRVINAIALIAQKAHIPGRKIAKSFFGYTD